MTCGKRAETTLLEAMKEAAGRDRIAYQYATGYADIFGLASTLLTRRTKKTGRRHGRPLRSTLASLLGIFDSHIARKNGLAAAEAVQRGRDRSFATVLCQRPTRPTRLTICSLSTGASKMYGLNPGTSADLTVATLFADRLTRILIQRGNNG